MVLTLGRNFPCYWVIIWFYKADTASSTRCYCSISRINNRRFSPDNNQPAWTMHSLKSTHSHSTLSHTDTYRLGVSLCYSATSAITDKNVRHLEWVRNSCYCIEVLPRELYHRWRFGMDKKTHPGYNWSCDYLTMLGLQLNHVSKRGSWLLG